MRRKAAVMVDIPFLWGLIEDKLKSHNLTYRHAGQQAGLCASTFSRLKHGKAVDIHNFCAVLNWLEIGHRTVEKQPVPKGA